MYFSSFGHSRCCSGSNRGVFLRINSLYIIEFCGIPRYVTDMWNQNPHVSEKISDIQEMRQTLCYIKNLPIFLLSQIHIGLSRQPQNSPYLSTNLLSCFSQENISCKSHPSGTPRTPSLQNTIQIVMKNSQKSLALTQNQS